MKNHHYCEWSGDFGGLMVAFRGSETDQYNGGCKQYVGITGNSHCAVLAFREWYRLPPAHFERSDVVPMFTIPDGRVLGRVEMQNDLRLAAIALKLPLTSRSFVKRSFVNSLRFQNANIRSYSFIGEGGCSKRSFACSFVTKYGVLTPTTPQHARNGLHSGHFSGEMTPNRCLFVCLCSFANVMISRLSFVCSFH